MRSLSFKKCMLIALIVGTLACIVIKLSSLLWEPSRGAVPTACVAMLALALLTPLLNRGMRRAGGYSAVIVTCRSVSAIAVWVALAVSDSFAAAFRVYEPFRFGEVSFARTSAFVLFVFAGIGACAGWAEIRVRSHRWDHTTYDPKNTSKEVKRRTRLSVVFAWVVFAIAAPILVCVFRWSFYAPTPERYTASLVHLGDVPPVTTELRSEYNGKTSYTNVVPTDPIGGYHLARHCNETFCQLWIAHEPLPASIDDELYGSPSPFAHVTIYASSVVSLYLDPAHRLLIVKEREERIWLTSDTLSQYYIFSFFQPKDIAVPPLVCAGGALGILLGVFLMRKPRTGDGSESSFEPARILRDGRIVFDDDRPGAHAPGAHAGVDGDVLVELKESLPTFRDSGAPKIERVFFGTIVELRAEQLQALHARAALAIAITFLLMAPVAAAALLGMF